MAEGDIDTVIKRTQESLGKYVKKPPLTEKLLKKPPFRFLHDVFNVIIKETGCFDGLYTAEELTFENIKDRDDKMRFLQKMIDATKIATNSSTLVRTSKIVAGQEPEQTNELLQLIASVIEQQLDWKSAVQRVNSVGGEEKPKTSHADKPKEGGKSRDKAREKPKDKEANKTKEPRAPRVDKPASKTISPTTKDDRPKKAAVSNGKANAKDKLEKVNKTTKDKTAGKENKEKDKGAAAVKKPKDHTEKSRSTKTKTEKSPSPLKMEQSSTPVKAEKILSPAKTEKKSAPTKVELRLESGKASLDNEAAGSKMETQNDHSNEKIASPTKLIEQAQEAAAALDVVAPRNDRRNSKGAEQLEEAKLLANGLEEVTNKATEIPKEPESRKSSAQRKGSSEGKRRRSSAHKTQRDDAELVLQQQQQSPSQMESLNTPNEETPAQLVAALAKAPIMPPPPAATESTKPLVPLNSEVKRESTFTRENSKDSTNDMNGARPRTSLRPPSARPASARPGAPRRRDKNVEIVLQPNDQLKMSGISVKLEAFGDLDDDGENLVIIEDANAHTLVDRQQDAARRAAHAQGNGDEALEQQGHLVQQILETQKELVQQPNGNQTANTKAKDGGGTGLNNARQSSARQMNSLRDVIQNLTKSVNPFGKLMDFIPEDIDSMQLEMTMWRDSYTQAAHELKREKSLTESATEPMKNQLVQIEANIREYREMIDASRTKILNNSEKALKMLTEQ